MAGGTDQQETASDQQLAQIADVKTAHAGHVRVISYVGEFTSVVTVQPVENIDVHVKFQLTGTYPYVPATIIVRSSVLTPEQNTSLSSHLQNEATVDGVCQSTLSDVVERCITWISENNIMPTPPQSKHKKSNSKNRSKQSKNAAKENATTEVEEANTKKSSMKTAADVIKRLQWDQALNKDDFIVGYMDRIVGLVERSFTAFTWENLAIVDHFALAIPQHRIQYFKYKSEKVWEKKERLDNVFGSTGSGITIPDAIRKFNEAEQREAAEKQREAIEKERETSEISDELDKCDSCNVASSDQSNNNVSDGAAGEDACIRSDNDNAVDAHDAAALFTDNETTATSKTDESNVVCSGIEVDSSSKENKDVFSTRTHLTIDTVESHDSTAKEEEESRKPISWDDEHKPGFQTVPDSRPTNHNRDKRAAHFNHFVAFHISNEKLVDALVEAQDKIISHYPLYTPYRTPRNGFHLTLEVMLLDSPDDDRECVQAMDKVAGDITTFLAKSEPLTFREIGYFSPKVIFAKVKCTPSFYELVGSIKSSLKSAWISIEDRSFKPHLTLFNVKRSHYADRSWPKAALELGALANAEFGTQSVDNIQVCRMGPLPSNATDTAFCYRQHWQHGDSH